MSEGCLQHPYIPNVEPVGLGGDLRREKEEDLLWVARELLRWCSRPCSGLAL
jgi:hypothetical protein